MSSKSNDNLFKKDMVGFTMPKLHKGKQSYVDFFAYDPVSDSMRRKKIMLDRFKSEKVRDDMAAVLIYNIYHRLLAGWNPFVNNLNTRQFTEVEVVMERYADYCRTSEAKGVLKHKTATDYISRARQLRFYFSDTSVKIKYIYQFDHAFVVDFLDYLVLDKDVSAKTRNNYRTWLSTFASWLMERKYIDENPVEGVRTLKESEKRRDALSSVDLARLSKYLQRANPPFYLACLMEYYTFIRPDELRYIKIGDISISRQTVTVSADVAKNRKEQDVALNDTVLKEMIRQEIFAHHSGEYLFGDNLFPGEKQMCTNKLRYEWEKVRNALSFPRTYQFYSLKDSGIRDLANAEGIVVARDQARHSDVAVTNTYLKHSHVVHESTKHFKGGL